MRNLLLLVVLWGFLHQDLFWIAYNTFLCLLEYRDHLFLWWRFSKYFMYHRAVKLCESTYYQMHSILSPNLVEKTLQCKAIWSWNLDLEQLYLADIQYLRKYLSILYFYLLLLYSCKDYFTNLTFINKNWLGLSRMSLLHLSQLIIWLCTYFILHQDLIKYANRDTR